MSKHEQDALAWSLVTQEFNLMSVDQNVTISLNLNKFLKHKKSPMVGPNKQKMLVSSQYLLFSFS